MPPNRLRAIGRGLATLSFYLNLLPTQPTMSDAPHSRLFVILARDAPVAAIICRGPSKWYQIIEWNTRRDRFTPGAWFKGRIYEEKCDLSPDGQLFAYFCHKGSKLDTDYTDSWTALSRLPWLHALGLWPSGTTYGGGGRFVTNRQFELRTGLVPTAHPQHPARGIDVITGSPVLQSSANLVDGADWSGIDQAKRLVYTREGKLFSRVGKADKELADFSDRTPNPAPAPDWAEQALS